MIKKLLKYWFNFTRDLKIKIADIKAFTIVLKIH